MMYVFSWRAKAEAILRMVVAPFDVHYQLAAGERVDGDVHGPRT